MHVEKSCGAVVFTRCGNDILYIVIRHNRGHCGFPKGHTEQSETEQETALREIYEEVGICATLIPGFRMVEEYPLPNKAEVTRQIIYFLGEYVNQEIHHRPEELTEAHLLPYDAALDMLTFSTAKDILSEANRFLLE